MLRSITYRYCTGTVQCTVGGYICALSGLFKDDENEKMWQFLAVGWFLVTVDIDLGGTGLVENICAEFMAFGRIDFATWLSGKHLRGMLGVWTNHFCFMLEPLFSYPGFLRECSP